MVKYFVANMGVPRVFRTDIGTKFTNGVFLDYCNSLGSRREFTAPRNGPVKSAITRAFKAGHVARLEVPQLFPDVLLEETQGCTNSAGASLWLEYPLWGSECLNRAATSANDEGLSAHEVFYGSRPLLALLAFFHPRLLPHSSAGKDGTPG